MSFKKILFWLRVEILILENHLKNMVIEVNSLKKYHLLRIKMCLQLVTPNEMPVLHNSCYEAEASMAHALELFHHPHARRLVRYELMQLTDILRKHCRTISSSILAST